MIYDIATIRNKLVTHHQHKFNDATKFPNCNLSDVVDIFLDIVEYQELPDIIDALNIFYMEDQCSRLEIARQQFAANFEAFLKGTFEILYKEKVTGSLRTCLKKFFADIKYELPKADEKNQQDVFFANLEKDGRYVSNCPAHFKDKAPFGFILLALKVTYELRNAAAHPITMIEYFDAEPKVLADKRHWLGDVEDCILAYLFVTYKYFEKLRRFLEPDMTRYLESVKLEFETERLRFVHIRGVFEDIIHVKSHPKVPYTQEFIPELSNDETVATLRGKISGRKMLVTGDAGMGKTTTLHYLAAEDADKLLNDYSLLSVEHPLPVYIELKDFKDDESNGRKVVVTVRDLILRQVKYGMDSLAKTEEEKLERYLDKLLDEGKITLFLDGLNEIPKTDKENKHHAINEFLQQFERVFFVLTSRKEDYKGVVAIQLPVFELQKMDVPQIAMFLQKNTDNIQVRDKINNLVVKNESFKEFIGIPLILSVLVEVVEKTGEIPSSDTKIIRSFTNQLYNWQCSTPHNGFDNEMSRKLHSLLSHLAFTIQQLQDTNLFLPESKVIAIFQERNLDHHLNIDLYFMLKTARELNILVEKEHRYVFVHQVFLEFYAQEELGDLDV
jgi:NACHT domain